MIHNVHGRVLRLRIGAFIVHDVILGAVEKTPRDYLDVRQADVEKRDLLEPLENRTGVRMAATREMDNLVCQCLPMPRTQVDDDVSIRPQEKLARQNLDPLGEFISSLAQDPRTIGAPRMRSVSLASRPTR